MELITVEAMGGALTIDAGEGTFTLTDSRAKPHPTPTPAATATPTPTPSLTTEFKALVTQESSLFFKGRNIVTKSVAPTKRLSFPSLRSKGPLT